MAMCKFHLQWSAVRPPATVGAPGCQLMSGLLFEVLGSGPSAPRHIENFQT
jgi:hypothetical protein